MDTLIPDLGEKWWRKHALTWRIFPQVLHWNSRGIHCISGKSSSDILSRWWLQVFLECLPQKLGKWSNYATPLPTMKWSTHELFLNQPQTYTNVLKWKNKLYIGILSFIIFFTFWIQQHLGQRCLFLPHVHMNYYDFAQMFNFYFRAHHVRPICFSWFSNSSQGLTIFIMIPF